MTTTECKIQTLRTKLANKAKQEPNFRFYNLYGHLLRIDLLKAAWCQVRNNGGGPGIDNISIDSFDTEDKVNEFLNLIQKDLQEKKYRPQPVKRVFIPKPNGKLRPLGIPTVKDRVIQAAVKLLLEPIFEQDFLDCSYGFRPNRSAHDALNEIRLALKSGKRAVYDADLKGYFDSIPHNKLLACVRMRVTDSGILKLIKLWLKAPIAEETFKGRGPKMTYPKKGTPQGGVISPLLANLYLHWFDKVFSMNTGPAKWAGAKLIRYADDFVIMAKYQSQRLIHFIEEKIEDWLELEINREKTKIVDINRSREKLNFLGYTFSYKADLRGGSHTYLCCEPSKDAVQAAKNSLNRLLATNKGYVPLATLISQVNRFLVGWGNYFSFGHDRKAKRKVNYHCYQRLTQHIRRRSQRPYRPSEGSSYYQYYNSLGLISL